MNLKQTIQTKRLMKVIAFKRWLISIIDLTEEDNEDNNNNDSTFNQSKKSSLNSNVITIDDDSEDDELYDHRYLGIMDEEESNDYLFSHLFKSQNTPLPENNKGRQLIKVIGYKEGYGLGKKSIGIVYPLSFLDTNNKYVTNLLQYSDDLKKMINDEITNQKRNLIRKIVLYIRQFINITGIQLNSNDWSGIEEINKNNWKEIFDLINLQLVKIIEEDIAYFEVEFYLCLQKVMTYLKRENCNTFNCSDTFFFKNKIKLMYNLLSKLV